MIRLLNAWTQAAWLAKRWPEMYGDRDPVLAKELAALGSRPNPDEVDRLFAKSRFKTNRVERTFSCDECGAEVAEAVRIDTDPDDHHATDLCVGCVLKALRLLEGDEDGSGR